MTATSSNYFAVALADDLANDPSNKVDARRQRIEAAVERSKSEYKPEHAYTERGSSLAMTASLADKPKVDRQQLEFLVSSLYYQQDYAQVLQLVLDALKRSPLNRELLDTGLRAALRLVDKESAVLLARSSKASWKGQSAGLACAASDAFVIASLDREAFDPLLASCSSFALHGPVLTRLHDLAVRRAELADFANLIAAVKDRKKYVFPDQLFEGDARTAWEASMVPEVDTDSLATHFDEHQKKDLLGTLQRLRKAASMQGTEVEVDADKGVREL